MKASQLIPISDVSDVFTPDLPNYPKDEKHFPIEDFTKSALNTSLTSLNPQPKENP